MKIKVKKPLVMIALAVILIGFIGFVEKRDAARKFSSLEVKVLGVSDVYFVNEQEIHQMVSTAFPHLQSGIALNSVGLHQIEQKVSSHPFVKNAEVFADLKGQVMIEIEQHIPIARIVRPNAPDGYISTEGIILPTSPQYTTRVMTLEGAFAESLLQETDLSKSHPEIMDLINYIHQDEFWKAQIAGLDMPKANDIRLWQQVGKQVIEFGDAHQLAQKFKKINLFYTEILPAKGWNTYSRVNVKYKDQIICE